MECAGHRRGVPVHGGLGDVDLQSAVQIRREPATCRVATNLVNGGTDRKEGGGAADERWLSVPLIFFGG